MKKFSSEFLLGAATAAHQVEGSNTNSDFWAMENVTGSMFKEPSGDSVDHFNRYKEDIGLMANAGLNAYRFTIEWARVQPAKDIFDDNAIRHYREMLEYCRAKGVEPIVTMHHFTSPKWLIYEGGWENESTADYFAAYCSCVVKELGHLMRYVCTINEANMGLQLVKLVKDMMAKLGDVQTGIDMNALMAERMKPMTVAFPGADPGKIHHFLSPRTPEGDLVIARAHEKARDAMKAVRPELQIGITLSLHDFQHQPGCEAIAHAEWDEEFLHYLPHLEKDDFIGVQNYSRRIIGKDGGLPTPEGAELTQMGYEYYPEAIGNVVRTVSKNWKKPIIITENGLSTDDDSRRVEFIKRALKGVQSCIDDGIDVRGYMYWSLLDNFEWMLGYEKTFGLIAVDRTTQTRTPKESLTVLGGYRG